MAEFDEDHKTNQCNVKRVAEGVEMPSRQALIGKCGAQRNREICKASKELLMDTLNVQLCDMAMLSHQVHLEKEMHDITKGKLKRYVKMQMFEIYSKEMTYVLHTAKGRARRRGRQRARECSAWPRRSSARGVFSCLFIQEIQFVLGKVPLVEAFGGYETG